MIRNKDSKAIADDLAPNSVHAVILERYTQHLLRFGVEKSYDL